MSDVVDRNENDEEKRLEKRREKKEKKKQKKREIRQVNVLLDTIRNIMNRIKRVEDMNLRCYLVLDKMAMMVDVSMAALLIDGELPKESMNKISTQVTSFQNELTKMMEWLMDNKEIGAVESVVNPIPDSVDGY